jgi:hypothetical protein
MTPQQERIPEPDAPVQVATYRSTDRVLWVIGAPDRDGKRLVVLTSLA